LFAVLGIVFELLVVKKQLLARGEHKLDSAVMTLQNSVDEFHGRLPQSRNPFSKSAMSMKAGPESLSLNVLQNNKGPGRHKNRAANTIMPLPNEGV